MLCEIYNDNVIKEEYSVRLENGVSIFTEILSYKNRKGKTAIFIHGGGVTGNHTLSERPSRWLIDKGIFSKVILPDRRGAGASSPFTHKTSLSELAEDIKLLLDKLNVAEPVTAIGVSYGGLVSLLLSAIDNRIEKVILIASSTTLKLTKGKLNYFYRKGIIQAIIKLALRIFTGNSEKKYVDMNFVYDLKTVPGLIMAQLKILRRLNRKNLKAFYLMVDSVFDEDNLSIPTDIKIRVPVEQIIGNKDNVWERNIYLNYQKQLPDFRQIIIEGARHRDVFFRAEEFLSKVDLLSSEI